MSNTWFRFYGEALNDPKVQKLPLASFKAWINALCIACNVSCNDGKIGTLEDVSFAFRETKDAVSSAFQPLLENGLIVTDGETFQIAKWGKRQYKSDTSTDRVKRFRQRSKNVTETSPDQIRTDTDQNRSEGDLKNFEKKKFIFTPTEDTHKKTIALAVGWDRQALYGKFSDWIRTTAKEIPQDDQKAFLGWVPKFIEGKNRKFYSASIEQAAE